MPFQLQPERELRGMESGRKTISVVGLNRNVCGSDSQSKAYKANTSYRNQYVLQAQGTVISLTTAEIAAMIVPIVEPDQSLLLTFASWELSENRY